MLLDITKQGHTSQDPVIRMLGALQCQACDVGQVSTPWFLVDRADIEARVCDCWVFCIDVDDRHDFKENFVLGLNQLAAAPVPASPFQVQAVDIDPFWWGVGDVILHLLGDIILHDHIVQGPTLMCSCHLLKNNMNSQLLLPLSWLKLHRILALSWLKLHPICTDNQWFSCSVD